MKRSKKNLREDEEWSLTVPAKRQEKPAPKAPKRSPSSTNARTRSGIPQKPKKIVTSPQSQPDEPMRIQKFLANSGVASRRTIEEWIKAGKITVNQAKATLGQSVTRGDTIVVDGKKLYLKAFDKQETRVLLYHKPEGELCAARSENDKPTIFESLPKIKGSKWVMVGRLDINTSGLLLLTNNGKLAHHLMHPSFAVERHYAVRVLGKVTEEMIENLTSGVRIDNELFRFQSVTFGGGTGANQWYHVTLSEGKYREVRRLWESQGCKVNRLIRTQYGPYVLPNGLRKGKYFELSADEVTELLAESGI